MNEDVSRGVMRLRSSRLCRALMGMIARICEIYEHLFTHRQGERSVQEFNGSLRTLLDELEIYQPFTVDISKMRQYKEELVVAIFLVGLTLALASQIRGPILGVETLPSLSSTFS